MGIFLIAYGISRTALLSPLNSYSLPSVATMFYTPYKQIYADSLETPIVKGM